MDSIQEMLDRPVGWDRPREFLSRKTGRRVIAKTRVHEDYLAFCSLDPEVEAIDVRPESIVLPGGDAHSPDFALRMADGSVRLVDVVLLEDIADPNLADLRARVASAAAERGLNWRPVTEASLRDDPRVANSRLIHNARAYAISAGDRIRVLQQLDETQGCSLLDAAKIVSAPANAVEMVLGLVMEGLVEMDLSKPLVPELTMRRSDYSYEISKAAA